MKPFQDILSSNFNRAIRARGLNYFRNGRVELETIDKDGTSNFKVTGSRVYKVTIQLNENQELFMNCSCPFSSENNCKHMAAALYYIDKNEFFRSTKVKASHTADSEISEINYEDYHPTISEEIISNIESGNEAMQAVIKSNLSDEKKLKIYKFWEEQGKREEQIKFNEVREKLSSLTLRSRIHTSVPLYRIAYGIEKFYSRFRIRLIRQTLNGNRSVTNKQLTTSVDFNTCEQLNPQEKIFIEYILNYFRIHENVLLKASQISSECFDFLKDKEVYLVEYGQIKDRIYIQDEKCRCSLFITGNEEELTLKLLLSAEGNNIVCDNNSIQIFYEDPLWIRIGSKLFNVVNSTYQQISSFQKSAGEIKIPRAFLQYFQNTILPNISDNLQICSDIYSITDIIEKPVKKIFLEEKENKLYIRLRFGYGKYTISYSDNYQTRTILSGKEIFRIMRNKADEERARAELKLLPLKENVIPGIFTPRKQTINFLFNSLPLLKEMGFEITGISQLKKYKVNTSAPKVSYSIASGVDWFELQTTINFNGVLLPLSDLLNSIKNKEKYIILSDGSVSLLSNEWVNSIKKIFSIGDVREEKIRFSKVQVNLLDAILTETEEYSTDSEFKSYLLRLNSFHNIGTQTVPKHFHGKLRDYQKFGLNWMYFLKEYSLGGILADDMGLGKTIQVLALLAKEKAQKTGCPSLIIAPTSVVFNWIREAEKFVPSLKLLNHTGILRNKENCDHFENYDIVITSYSVILRDHQIFASTQFHYLILDESQKIKNPLSKTGRSIKKIKANYALCLTGTPVENNLNDLWAQMSFLNPGLLGSLRKYQETFVKPIQRYNDQNTAELLRRTVYPFILRRTKEVVAKELPPKSEIIRYCQMESGQQKLYESWKESIRLEIFKEIENKGIKNSGFKIIEGLLRLRQLCNHPELLNKEYKEDSAKFEEFKEMINKVISEGHKVLIFSQFVQMLEIIRHYLDSEQIQYEYLTGSTVDREKCVDNFQNNSQIKAFLISLKAGGFGLNLTEADYVFHYDPWWNPAVEAQATDRTHRIGQNRHVIVYKFVTKDTVEEKILLLQEKKRRLVESIITTETGILKNITREDINLLFG